MVPGTETAPVGPTAADAPEPAVVHEVSRRSAVVRTFVAFVSAIVAAGLLFAVLGADPVAAYRAIVDGSVGSSAALGQTFSATTPLVLTGIAAAIPFTARLWNIGGEGQFFVGAVAAVVVALSLPDLSPWLVTLLALLAGMAAGAILASVAGVLKALVDANEVIVTLMLNFLATLLASWVITGPFKHGISPQTRKVPDGVDLPKIWPAAGITVGEVLAVCAAIAAFVLVRRTRLGFAIKAMGANESAARRAGFNLKATVISAFSVAGAFAGLAGAIAVVGVNKALVDGISENYGFIGVAVALLARLHPLWILPSAALFGAITVGSQNLTATTGVSPAMASVMIALFVILMLAFGVIRLRYPEER